jgi:hypothetical protein
MSNLDKRHHGLAGSGGYISATSLLNTKQTHQTVIAAIVNCSWYTIESTQHRIT